MVENKPVEQLTEEERQARIEELKRQRSELIGQIKGLLGKFVFDKLRSYVEPSRRGTPKGEPIGLTRTKYEVSLYMLFNLSVKEIADRLHVSYGLVRKWRTEREFNKAVLRHMVDFTTVFEGRLRQAAKDDLAFHEKYLSEAPLEEIAKGNIAYPRIDDFSDLGDYALRLRMYVAYHLSELLEEEKASDPSFWAWAIRIVRFFEEHPIEGESKPKANPKLTKKRHEVRNLFVKSVLNDVIELLKKPGTAETERRQAIDSLATIRDTIINE